MTNTELIAEARKLLEDYPNYQEYPGGPLLKYPHQDALLKVTHALEAAEARVKGFEANFPCDGGCNYDSGPEESCSLHGRNPADLWGIIANISAECYEAEVRIAELEAGEWEYGVKWHDSQDPVWYHPYTADEAEKKLADWPKDPGYVVRRRKAGEWVPVESEGTDD